MAAAVGIDLGQSTQQGTSTPRAGGPAEALSHTRMPPTTTTTAPVVELGQIPQPNPGAAQTIYKAPAVTSQIAITIDDGYCAPCADAYVQFVQTTGTHITFSPNGTNSSVWDPLAEKLEPLIAAGQVQIGNHTYSHSNLLDLSTDRITQELEQNDEWIQQTFGITSRPWFRPPYGYHDDRVDELAGELGYTHVLMWNGTFGDSTPITSSALLSLANQYLRGGVILLGHANVTTIVPLLPTIYETISERGLDPVTLDEMFGTSRNTG